MEKLMAICFGMMASQLAQSDKAFTTMESLRLRM